MLGVYNYTVILTYVGMLTGFTGIAFAVHGDLRYALLCLMIAGACDMFDGAVASTMERTDQEKRFGIQIDSLSDLICFGVLPAIIVYIASESSLLSFLSGGVYVLCSLIRLAWFNVDEEDRQQAEASSRQFYLGLPVTTAALLLPALMMLTALLSWHFARTVPGLLLVMSVLFLSPIPLRKPQFPGKLVMALCGMAELAVLCLRSGL